MAYYDNLSRIPELISDQLCKAVTGWEFTKRKIYTNDEDVVYNKSGINLAATKADLLSRGLIIQTDTIPKGIERRVKAIWDEFDNYLFQTDYSVTQANDVSHFYCYFLYC